VSIYDVHEGREKGQLGGLARGQALALSSNGAMVAFGGREKVEIWNVASATVIAYVKHSPDLVAVAFSEDDQWLSMVGKDGTAKVWKLGAPQFSVSVEQNCKQLVFSPLVRSVAAVVDSRTIRVIATASDELLSAIEMDPSFGAVQCLAFSPDGRHLAIANSSGGVVIVRLEGSAAAGNTPK
jgi:WD40 repeat protein